MCRPTARSACRWPSFFGPFYCQCFHFLSHLTYVAFGPSCLTLGIMVVGGAGREANTTGDSPPDKKTKKKQGPKTPKL